MLRTRFFVAALLGVPLAAVAGGQDARPFTLQTPYRNDWSKERAMVSAGVLVVLEVDPALVVPRDSLEPVLYAGDVAVSEGRIAQVGAVSGRGAREVDAGGLVVAALVVAAALAVWLVVFLLAGGGTESEPTITDLPR